MHPQRRMLLGCRSVGLGTFLPRSPTHMASLGTLPTLSPMRMAGQLAHSPHFRRRAWPANGNAITQQCTAEDVPSNLAPSPPPHTHTCAQPPHLLMQHLSVSLTFDCLLTQHVSHQPQPPP
eukprot:365455-Chlamydomonas_euryale.AAC.26